jgi:hypothetical protein
MNRTVSRDYFLKQKQPTDLCMETCVSLEVRTEFLQII